MNMFPLEIENGFLKQESSDVLEPLRSAGRADSLTMSKRNLSLSMKRGVSWGEHASYLRALASGNAIVLMHFLISTASF